MRKHRFLGLPPPVGFAFMRTFSNKFQFQFFFFYFRSGTQFAGSKFDINPVNRKPSHGSHEENIRVANNCAHVGWCPLLKRLTCLGS